MVAADSQDELGHKVADDVNRGGGEAIYVHLDTSREADWAGAVAQSVRRFGKLTTLCNVAGIYRTEGTEAETMEGWQRIIAVDQTGVWLGMKAAIPEMKKAGGGAIVTGDLEAPASGPFAPEQGLAVQQTVALPFDSVRLRTEATGGPLGLPKGDPLVLAKGDLPLRLYGKYKLRQSALSTGLVVREKSAGVGAVYGRIELLRAESFTGTSSTGLSFIDATGKDAPLYLLQPGASGATGRPASIHAG